jgi:hypothetical protein
MWDGVTSIDEQHDPIVYEGEEQALVIVMNSGPGSVELISWKSNKPEREQEPMCRIELRPGNTKAVKGPLIRVRLHSEQWPGSRSPRHAAIGWRVRL